jgi:hypothetical protein
MRAMASEFPILTKLGGDEEVTRKLVSLGHPIGKDAVRMWRQRQRIPGNAIPVLMSIAERERIKYRSSDFEAA